MPERITLNNSVRRLASHAKDNHPRPSDAFAHALKKRLDTTFTDENSDLFSNLLTRLESAERGRGE
jgi:hypothetical protein